MPVALNQAPAVAAHAHRVVVLVVATLALGIALDATALPWAQPVVSAWSWAALLWIAAHSAPRHRMELAACVVLATAGEVFLKDVWGLYDYRLGNLPLFIPAGHALVFAAAARMSRAAPAWLPRAVAHPVRGRRGLRRLARLRHVRAACGSPPSRPTCRFSANPRLCATLFLFAFAIEA